MYDVRVSTVDELMQSGQAEALFAEHWEELATHREVTRLQPDPDYYRKVEPTGTLLIVTAWDGAKVVGYSVNFITLSPHFGVVTVMNDLLFLSKDYRRGTGLGLALMNATEQHGTAKGAELVMWLSKPDTPLARLMDRLGYVPQEVIYTKGI